MFGSFIERGPQDWQVIQQRNGYADIELAGRYCSPPNTKGQPQVYARVVREDDNRALSFWQKAEMNTQQKYWSIRLYVPKGGLYRIETNLAVDSHAGLEWALRGDMRLHIGVGDVFVIAGQSNSAGYGKDPMYDPPQLGVHLYRNCGRWDIAAHPMNESTDTVHPVNQETCNPGNSPYLAFGKMLYKELGYPIGFLQTSLGASPLSKWNPHEDGSLYSNMLEVIRSQGGTVKAVLWYQGCSDCVDELCETYLERFGYMVESLRGALRAKIPFLTVQLNRVTSIENVDHSHEWASIREAQRQAANHLEEVYIIPTEDYTLMSDQIHNSAVCNVAMGERLAALALCKLYGRDEYSAAPDLERIIQTGPHTLELFVKNVRGRLFCFNTIPDFEVEDEKGP